MLCLKTKNSLLIYLEIFITMIWFYNKEWTYIYPNDFIKIKESFELKNLKKVQARQMWMWNANKLPDLIKHHRVWKDWLIKVPAWIRSVWLSKFENKYWWLKKINHPPLQNPFWNEEDIDLTQKQNKAIEELLQRDVWLLWASTWTWKTSVISKIIDKLKVKTLVVCCNLELMNQMRDDLEMFFWVKCRTLSWVKTKQKWCYEDIIIANIDTVAKQDFEYLQQFDLVLFDEVDKYLWADNRVDFLFNCPMKYQYWLTWTIKVNHVDDKIFKVYFWHRVELLLKHFSPNIYKVLTDFQYILDDIKDFHELKAALYENNDRNELIIQTIVDTIQDRKGIVFCEYVEHSRIICDMLEKKWIKTFMLIWEVKKEERSVIKKQLKEYKWWPCCLVGSVKIIGRGFSVPELSVWYLTTCEKFSSNIEQYLWRVCRLFPWKTSCDWYDFIDTGSNILANQAKARHTQYKKAYPNSKINFY